LQKFFSDSTASFQPSKPDNQVFLAATPPHSTKTTLRTSPGSYKIKNKSSVSVNCQNTIAFPGAAGIYRSSLTVCKKIATEPEREKGFVIDKAYYTSDLIDKALDRIAKTCYCCARFLTHPELEEKYGKV